MPRHAFSSDHIDYTVAAIKDLYNRRHTIPNVAITRGRTMKLRHFSAGLKPVPVDQTLRGTILDDAGKQLNRLSLVVGHDLAAREQFSQALALATGKWGQARVPKHADPAAWVSSVSNDGSPIEFSVSIDQQSGQAELRFLIEAQPDENSWNHLTEAALHLNKDIVAAYPTAVSLRRFDLIRDLFMPAQLQSEGHRFKMAAWHSCAWSAKKGAQWKIYLDPSAGDDPVSVTREAFSRLGLESGWQLVEGILSPTDSVVYFSLDLSSDQDEARVKVYIAHNSADATSRSLAAEVAQKHVSICPDADAFEIQRFLAAMSGRHFGRDGHGGKPLISCFAFAAKTGERPVGTVHFPIDAYVQQDAEARKRVEEYLTIAAATTAAREKYARVVAAAQRRPMDRARGMHAWVSLKQSAGARRENTFYLCPEIFGR